MKLGLDIAATNWRGGPQRFGETLAHAAEAAEAAGFDAISVTDHVWGSQYTGGVEARQVEAYTTLGFIAARTQRVRLLTLATAASAASTASASVLPNRSGPPRQLVAAMCKPSFTAPPGLTAAPRSRVAERWDCSGEQPGSSGRPAEWRPA